MAEAQVPARGRSVDRGDRSRDTAWGLALSCALVLIALPVLVAQLTLTSLSRPSVVLAFGIAAYSGARLALLLVRGANRPVTVTFWVFVYVFFGIAALANTVNETYPLFGQTFGTRDEVAALLTCIVGLAGYEIGVRAFGNLRSHRRLLRALQTPTVRIGRVAVVGAIGLVAVTYFTLRFGLATRFSSRQNATAAFLGVSPSDTRLYLLQNKASGLIRLVLDGIPVFVALFLTVSWRRVQRVAARDANRPVRRGVFVTGLLAALSLGVLLADNPLSNPRSRFVEVALLLLLAVFPLVTPRRFRLFAVALIFGTLFVYPLADYFRYNQRTAETASLSKQMLTSPDFAMFQQEINAHRYVELSGHGNGRQFLGTVFAMVPSQFWASKPPPTGKLIFPRAAQTLATSVSVWGWAYVDGGNLWVLIVFVLFGAATAAIESAYRTAPRDRLTLAAVAAPLCAACQGTLLRGDPATAMTEIMPILFFTLVACRFTRLPSR